MCGAFGTIYLGRLAAAGTSKNTLCEYVLLKVSSNEIAHFSIANPQAYVVGGGKLFDSLLALCDVDRDRHPRKLFCCFIDQRSNPHVAEIMAN